MSGKPALAVALLTVTLGALRLQPLCAQVLPLTSRQLAADSSHVVVAVVEDARSRWNPERTLIVTEYDLRIEDRLQGDAPERVTLAVPGGTVGRETHDTSLSTHLEAGARYLLFLGDLDRPTFTPVTGGWQGGFQETDGREGKRSFGELVRSARAVIAAVEARPEPADTVRRRPEDPGLPAKTYGRLTRPIPESAAVALSRPVAEKFIVRNAARAPIVFNTLLPGTPFSAQDQKQMAYWNLYAGDLFRVSPHPSPHWAFGNGVFDIAGFPSSEQMQQQFDMAWDRFAYSLTAWRTVDGHIVEADLAFNPAFQWTVDDVRSTQSGGPLSFKDALLSNLGTAWGYRGLVDHGFGRLDLSPVTRDSIKNLKAPPYDLATLFAEDAAAARSTYGGSPIRDGVVSPYGITPAPLTPLYVPVRGPTGSVRAGTSFSLINPIKIENAGTVDLANPLIEVHLVPKRFSLKGAILVKTVRLRGTLRPGDAATLALGRITVPGSVPAGTYFFAFVLSDRRDAYQANNRAWSNHDVRIAVTSR